MAGEAKLSARLGLDDSELKRKVREQEGNYQKLLRENQRYKQQLEAQNEKSRQRELAGERQFTEKMIAESRRAAQVRLDASRQGWLRHNNPAPAIQRPALSGNGPGAMTGGWTSVGPGALAGSGTASWSGGGPGRGATNAGMGMLMLSQTIDDLQYGIKGVVNNIAPLVMSLGGGTGLAGVLTIAAVGVNQFVDVLEKFGGTARLQAQNAENVETRRRQIARAMEDAAASGGAAGSALLGAEASAERSRQFQALQEDRAAELSRLRAELAGIVPSSVEDRRAAVAKLESQIAAVELRVKEARMAKNQAVNEMEALKEKKRLREDDYAARIAAEEAFIRKIETIGEGSIAGSSYLSFREKTGTDPRKEARERLADLKAAQGTPAAEDVRLAELNALMPALDQNLAGRRAKQNEAMQSLQEERHALEVARLQEQIDNAEKGRELGLEAGREVMRFFTQTADTFERAARRDREVARKEEERAREAAGMSDFSRQHEIDGLRARGKKKQADELQRGLDLDRDAAAIEARGFSPEAARRMAGERQANADLVSGKKRPRAGSMTTEEFRAQFGDGGAADQSAGLGYLGQTKTAFTDNPLDPFGLKEAAAKRAAGEKSNLAVLQKGAEKGGAGAASAPPVPPAITGPLREIVDKLTEMAAGLLGTAAEGLQPKTVN